MINYITNNDLKESRKIMNELGITEGSGNKLYHSYS